MQYLKLENISKSYGEKILFENISLSISKGDKIALIARNGAGKSTLLRVIAGEESPEGEKAQVYLTKDVRISFLKQDPFMDKEQSIHEKIMSIDNPTIQAYAAYQKAQLEEDSATAAKYSRRLDELHGWGIEAKMHELLAQINLSDTSQILSSLSGGQLKRLSLACVLLEEPDFLIMDEPTNHLDIDMIEWLEEFLQNPKLTLLMVTHDRYFLDRVCNEIIELERGVLQVYRGNYSDYLEKKAERLANEKVNLEKSKKLFKKELDWIRRQPQARTTKAKSRVDDFDRIKKDAHKNLDIDNAKIDLKSSRLGSKILEAHAVSKSFGDKNILEAFSYKFRKGERLGIVGPNGAGKSTFLNIITKELRPDGGKIIVGDTIKFGYYTQDGITIKEDKRVIDVIRDIAEYIPLEKGKKLTAERMLENFLFPRPQQQVYVSQLSGGEKRRLYLLTVLMANPNFLILDEPTNDLDIMTLNVLEDYLMSFPGCVLIVTHDRFFLDKMVDHLFILEGNGKIKDYNGKYSDFRKQSKKKQKSEQAAPKEKSEKNLDHQERKRIKNQVRKLEREMETLEKRKLEIQTLFTQEPEMELDKMMTLSKELKEVEAKLSESEDEAWRGSESLHAKHVSVGTERLGM